MNADRLSYGVVTPARNEEENLQRLGDCLAAQHLQPTYWVIVVDASTDGTLDVARRLATENAWIHVVDVPGTGAVSEGRQEGRDLHAFRAGIRALPHWPDVVLKQDADTSVAPDYFSRLMERFEADSQLGIAGGACYELESGEWVRRKVSPTHPRGASRAYRRDCLPTVMELEPKMGWDGIDEARAHADGYRTEAFLDLPFYHHRAVGGRERSVLQHGIAQGKAAWYMGYRPTYVVGRALYRVPQERSAPGIVWGYVQAALRREPRCPDREAVQILRDQQRMRRALLRGTPP